MSNREVAERAATEYEQQTGNPYFDSRPEAPHRVLVGIILGAHNIMMANKTSPILKEAGSSSSRNS